MAVCSTVSIRCSRPLRWSRFSSFSQVRWDDGLVSTPIRLAILGATGSIGRQALDVVRAQPDRLRPVDSEHNGLWQCLVGEDLSAVSRVALTASGGAFRDVPLEALPGVTPQHALRHPTWTMGPKVTIDSATLVNKGYEVVETHW